MQRDGQLVGVRVLDFGVWRPAPYATQLLAELGADVAKVEPPGGDPMRNYPDLFTVLSMHKRSLELDLRSDEGRARAVELAAEADVAIEGYRPGVADRLGIGWEALRAVNPRLVYCSISGFGQTGPLASVSGHDINYQAVSGMLAEVGGGVPKVPIADIGSGLAAAFAICAALVRVARTGSGERIDVAMTDVLATWVGAVESVHLEGDAAGEAEPGMAGYGSFPTRGGDVALGITTEDHFWRPLCDALGLGELRDLGPLERSRRSVELNAVIAGCLVDRDRDEVVAELSAQGVPVSATLSRTEMLQHRHFSERGVVVDGMLGHPVLFSEAPALPPAPSGEFTGWRPR